MSDRTCTLADHVEAIVTQRDALQKRVEALTLFVRPFADAIDMDCHFMMPPEFFADGFDVRARARAALQWGSAP